VFASGLDIKQRDNKGWDLSGLGDCQVWMESLMNPSPTYLLKDCAGHTELWPLNQGREWHACWEGGGGVSQK
jgi:hypothetical protein